MSTIINDEELASVSGGAGQVAPYKMYIVKSGDCISMIAQAFGCTSEEIYRLNRIDEKTVIHPGDQLIVPNTKAMKEAATAL